MRHFHDPADTSPASSHRRFAEWRWRGLVMLLALLFITGCAALAWGLGRELPWSSVFGVYISILAVTALLYKLPFRLYLYGIGFALLANAFGTVLNFYKYVPYYDKMLHFASGILLCEIGRVLFEGLLKRMQLSSHRSLTMLFAVLFAVAGAGVWEIYEFAADQLVPSVGMQGGNTDTMTDIIAGTLGALVYGLLSWGIARWRLASKKQDTSQK